MGAIADLSDLINRASGGSSGSPEVTWFTKSGRVAGAAATATIVGQWASLWTYEGSGGGGGSAPGAVAAPTSATVGALIPFTDPGGTREKWLVQACASSRSNGTLLIYDRLLHISGLGGTTTGAQTVGGSLTRNTGGAGNFVFAEIYGILGTTSRTITMSYTNQAGTTGRTSTAVQIGATNYREVTRALMLPLQSGDTGVRAVASVTLSASTGTAGDFGVTVGRPVAAIGVEAMSRVGSTNFTVTFPGLPKVDAGSCLAFLWLPSVTAPTELVGALGFVEA